MVLKNTNEQEKERVWTKWPFASKIGFSNYLATWLIYFQDLWHYLTTIRST